MRHCLVAVMVIFAGILVAPAFAQSLPAGAAVLPATEEPPPAYASYLERNAWCDRYVRAHGFAGTDYQREFMRCYPDPVAYKNQAH